MKTCILSNLEFLYKMPEYFVIWNNVLGGLREHDLRVGNLDPKRKTGQQYAPKIKINKKSDLVSAQK